MHCSPDFPNNLNDLIDFFCLHRLGRYSIIAKSVFLLALHTIEKQPSKWPVRYELEYRRWQWMAEYSDCENNLDVEGFSRPRIARGTCSAARTSSFGID